VLKRFAYSKERTGPRSCTAASRLLK
jgi:hypothetical protein